LPEPEPPPGELFLENRVEYPQADPYGRRVARDGRVHDLSSEDAHFENGEWRFESIPLAWREIVRLDEQTVRSLEDLVRREGVLELPEEQTPEGTVACGALVTWSVAVDGETHTVRLVNMDVSRVPALAALDHALQLAVGEALHPPE
jgi:transcription elongation GreA/GreB family factor